MSGIPHAGRAGLSAAVAVHRETERRSDVHARDAGLERAGRGRQGHSGGDPDRQSQELDESHGNLPNVEARPNRRGGAGVRAAAYSSPSASEGEMRAAR
jgi:hypothetical protein